MQRYPIFPQLSGAFWGFFPFLCEKGFYTTLLGLEAEPKKRGTLALLAFF
jgi:hypothetical protein